MPESNDPGCSTKLTVTEKHPQIVNSGSNSTIDTDVRTGFRLKRRLVSEANCQRGLQNVQFIPLLHVQNHVAQYNSIRIGIKPSQDWATMGVIDKCHLRDDFCVVRMTDMKGDYLYVYITDKAYKKFENAIGMGSVLVFKRPNVLVANKANGTAALHVSQIQQMWVVGQSLDLVCCQGYSKQGQVCEEWIDRRAGEYCDVHLTKVCNYSKNGRMELASGDVGIDIRWATAVKQADGRIVYQAKKRPDIKSTAQKKVEAYYIKGKGLINVKGELFKKALQEKNNTADNNENIAEFLKGRRDNGSEMIRKLKGIEEEKPKQSLTKEALQKMGLGKNVLSEEEEEAKKRSFDALNKETQANIEKKPRFILL
ncbi:hypothetical protein G6F55_005386 [Rhizopus delemar]|nr:hypothetical protein G6F55_005386 [Rhizopus delemar]